MHTVLTGVAVVSCSTAAAASETVAGPIVEAWTVLCTIKPIFTLWTGYTHTHTHNGLITLERNVTYKPE